MNLKLCIYNNSDWNVGWLVTMCEGQFSRPSNICVAYMMVAPRCSHSFFKKVKRSALASTSRSTVISSRRRTYTQLSKVLKITWRWMLALKKLESNTPSHVSNVWAIAENLCNTLNSFRRPMHICTLLRWPSETLCILHDKSISKTWHLYTCQNRFSWNASFQPFNPF